jgi:hypothetical protein
MAKNAPQPRTLAAIRTPGLPTNSLSNAAATKQNEQPATVISNCCSRVRDKAKSNGFKIDSIIATPD